MSDSINNNPPAQMLSAQTPSDNSAGHTSAVYFSAQFKVLDDLREFVGQEAQVCGLDEKSIYAVQLAVDEAFTNIIEHAFGGECQASIECICQCTPVGLEITLIDCGKPFNPSVVPDPDLVSDLEDRQIGGLGLYFMHKMMDEVWFTFAAETDEHPGCNILKMVKRKKKVKKNPAKLPPAGMSPAGMPPAGMPQEKPG
jgi:anti-sigma regulatory factor (Ser/Thr protein kinase)